MAQNALVKRIQGGDREAVSELVSRYGKMVYYTAYAETGDEDRALDVTKRTFRQLLSTIRKGEVPDDLTKHLQRQVRLQNKCVTSEESLTDALMADIRTDNDIDSIFSQISSSGHDDDSPDVADTASGAVSDADKTIPAISPSTVPPVAVSASAIPQVEAAADDASVTTVLPSAEVPVMATMAINAQEPYRVPANAVPEVTQNGMDPYQGGMTPPFSQESYPMTVPAYASDTTMVQPPLVPENDLAGVDSEIHERFYGQADEKKHRKGRAGSVIGVILVVLLILLLLWLLFGFLGKMQILPSYDLGYTWFNNNVYPLF